MGMKRRAFLIGGASVVGGGLFALHWANGSAASKGGKMIAKAGESSFSGWIKIATDDTITLYSPHIDFGQGSHTALAQMLADELDADWSKMRTEAAPAEMAFANTALGKGFILGAKTVPAILTPTVNAAFGAIARYMELQITGGSSAIRATGQAGFRVIGAAAREALVATAAKRLGVPESELTTADSKVTHAKSGLPLKLRSAHSQRRQSSRQPRISNILANHLIVLIFQPRSMVRRSTALIIPCPKCASQRSWLRLSAAENSKALTPPLQWRSKALRK
jgi:isoquinoline 1-oxidoreductase subunit beta